MHSRPYIVHQIPLFPFIFVFIKRNGVKVEVLLSRPTSLEFRAMKV